VGASHLAGGEAAKRQGDGKMNCENCNFDEFAIGFDGVPYYTNCGETVNVEDNTLLDVVLQPYLTR